jgi:WD40 repeat protein
MDSENFDNKNIENNSNYEKNLNPNIFLNGLNSSIKELNNETLANIFENYNKTIVNLANELIGLKERISHLEEESAKKDRIIEKLAKPKAIKACNSNELVDELQKVRNKVNYISSKIYGLNYLTLEGHQDDVTCMIQIEWDINESTIITSSNDKTIKIWDIDKEECIDTLKGHTDYVLSIEQVKWTKDASTIVSSSADKTIRLWNIETRKCLSILIGHTSYINSTIYLNGSENDTTIASCSVDSIIKIWDIETRKCITEFKGHEGSITCLTFLDSNNRLISGGLDKTLKVWCLDSGKLIKTLEGHVDGINCLLHMKWEFNDYTVLSGSDDNMIRIWDMNKFYCINVLEQNSPVDCLLHVKWDKNDSSVATSSEGRIRIYDINKGEYREIYTDCERIYCLIQLNSENRRTTIITDGDDYGIRLWNC